MKSFCQMQEKRQRHRLMTQVRMRSFCQSQTSPEMHKVGFAFVHAGQEISPIKGTSTLPCFNFTGTSVTLTTKNFRGYSNLLVLRWLLLSQPIE
jgi:hypothetical protein